MEDFKWKSDLMINTLINRLIVPILIGRRELDSFKQYNYHLPTKFGKGNVFTGVWIRGGGYPPQWYWHLVVATTRTFGKWVTGVHSCFCKVLICLWQVFVWASKIHIPKRGGISRFLKLFFDILENSTNFINGIINMKSEILVTTNNWKFLWKLKKTSVSKCLTKLLLTYILQCSIIPVKNNLFVEQSITLMDK